MAMGDIISYAVGDDRYVLAVDFILTKTEL